MSDEDVVLDEIAEPSGLLSHDDAVAERDRLQEQIQNIQQLLLNTQSRIIYLNGYIDALSLKAPD